MFKAHKVRLYPTKAQSELIDKTIGCCRFIYNAMLIERTEFYTQNKGDKKILATHKYTTIKEYREEFPWLKEVSSWAINNSRRDLDKAYKNFYRRVARGQAPGFPKLKKKGRCKDTYQDYQTGDFIQVNENKTHIKLLKLGKVKIKGLSKEFDGKIKSVTVTRSKSGKYFASILVDREPIKRKRVSDNVVGVDLGLKEFVVCSNGEIIEGVKAKLSQIDFKIRKQQRHLSRKQKGSKRYEKCKRRLNVLYEHKRNCLDHFQWHLVNKLCSENKVVVVEDLSIQGMKRNRRLSNAVHTINWGSFIVKLQQKAVEYETCVHVVDRWFPSSKLCSVCGNKKDDLKLSDRTYKCSCGHVMDRDLNAAMNLKNEYLKSVELIDYKHGEDVRPVRLVYQAQGNFVEVLKDTLGGSWA